ncbi:hypothetical protein HMPREF9151_00499 [Hoylesella saccharolytica F0055]|uniref:Uncharacterized protein n=1 Tax=Hoylesella saccharolytica F0055 TaxID=1127699 RepID=L1NII3_9BACT|nr:hypothetical protein HMPREF9151_00499 [Hoylesella saccharolytica F0055]
MISFYFSYLLRIFTSLLRLFRKSFQNLLYSKSLEEVMEKDEDVVVPFSLDIGTK